MNRSSYKSQLPSQFSVNNNSKIMKKASFRYLLCVLLGSPFEISSIPTAVIIVPNLFWDMLEHIYVCAINTLHRSFSRTIGWRTFEFNICIFECVRKSGILVWINWVNTSLISINLFNIRFYNARKRTTLYYTQGHQTFPLPTSSKFILFSKKIRQQVYMYNSSVGAEPLKRMSCLAITLMHSTRVCLSNNDGFPLLLDCA